MALSPGDKLGPYEILAPLGAGGMGEVWKARDTRLDRIVAIKQLKGDQRERFEQEARAIAALNHPHICQIYDVGPDYLVLEFVEGAPLCGPLSTERVLPLALQIVSALEAAHKRGVLHRDLKPANVMVTESGAKLLDFGLAKLTADTDTDATRTVQGTLLGTAAYMSPEQAQGKPADARSDVFSFGAILYELLSGRRAFPGDSIIDVLAAVTRDEPAQLPASSLARVAIRCLRKTPADRYQSMAEVRAALEQSAAHNEGEPPSIAVLPFINMSRGADDEFFSDGLTEEIINALNHIPGLKVIARTSAFAFKGQSTDIRKIAEILGVATILEGSVRRAGTRIRVTAQLITASDGTHLWSERYDRELADVFAVQDEIAAAIAEKLRMKLAPAPRASTPNLAAYEELLKARHYLGRWSPDAAAKGQEGLKRAIALDPSFAVARCELAWFYFALATENRMTPQQAGALMKAEAEEALRTDPALPEAQAVLGAVALLDYNWKEAGPRFELAMAREPIQPSVRGIYSLFYLAPTGRMREANEQMDRLLKEDPLNAFFRTHSGAYLLAAGRPKEAEARQKQVLELDPNFWISYAWLGYQYLMEGRLAEAVEMCERVHSMAAWSPAVAGILAGLLERTGNQARAQTLLERLGDGTAFGAPVGFMAYFAALRDADRTVGWFEKAIEQRDTRCPWISPHMLGDIVLSSPRWPELARKMNLPEVVW